MPTAETPTTNQETWLDWQPEGAPLPQLLSHDELLSLLHSRGNDVSPYTLEHYRRNGILPRPVRRQHAGKVRPVYPIWFVPAIETLKELQGLGWTLDEIKPHLKAQARTVVMNDPLVSPRAALEAAARSYASAVVAESGFPIATVRITLLDSRGNDLDHHDIPCSRS
jgi:DNA-binding transcriptional MerR regulator